MTIAHIFDAYGNFFIVASYIAFHSNATGMIVGYIEFLKDKRRPKLMHAYSILTS